MSYAGLAGMKWNCKTAKTKKLKPCRQNSGLAERTKMTIKINDRLAKIVAFLALVALVSYGMLCLKNSIINYVYTNFTAPFLH